MSHVVLAADEAYVGHVPCSLLQLSIHAPAIEGVTILVPAEMDRDLCDGLVASGRTFDVPVEVVPLTEVDAYARQQVLHSRGHVSAFTYSKLLMPTSLPHLDQVLYLDIDTLVRGNLDELLNWQLEQPLGAVHELGSNAEQLFGSVRVPYFNAGVLRLSLERLRELDLWNQALAFIRDRPRAPFQDQDVLNFIFRDQHDVLPASWNVFDSHVDLAPELQVLRDPAIVHFVGPIKPWHRESRSRFAREWRSINARALGLDAAEAHRYAEEDLRARLRLADRIATMRHSQVGRRIRAAMPLRFKHGVNSAILKAAPPESRLTREITRGLLTSSGSSAVDSADAARESTKTRLSRASVGLSRRREPSELILMVSAPRSGTNALGALMVQGFPDLVWEREFFSGHGQEATVASLVPRYPWIADREDPSFSAHMAQSASNVVDDVLALRPGLTMMKVFPNHLPFDSLESVMEEHRPRVLFLRRTMLFSYVSFRKAQAAGSWFQRENSDVAVSLNDAEVMNYVERMDAWFDSIATLSTRLGLDSMWLTYHRLYESREDLVRLRSFLADWDAYADVDQPDAWLPNTLIQDRRTDASMSAVIEGLSKLSVESRAALMRLPRNGLDA